LNTHISTVHDQIEIPLNPPLLKGEGGGLYPMRYALYVCDYQIVLISWRIKTR